jgi:YegS/Rv2252/BmrU family lipid kinase
MSLLKSIGVRFDHDLTEAPRHAIELAKSAAKKGYEMVVSVGGDGTINEIVNGLYDAGNLKDIMLGIISTGTGSDYIRTIGIPRQLKEACQHLLNPKKLTMDIGVVSYHSYDAIIKRLFVNFAGLGFDAEVVKATTQKFKALGTVPSYLVGLLSTLLSYNNREVSLKLDGKTEERKVCAIVMSNGKYGGGSMYIAPQADPRDGLLDVMVIGDLSKPDLLWSLPRIYKGTHLSHPKVTARQAKEIEVNTKEPMALQADGELLGDPPVSFSILPAALNVII